MARSREATGRYAWTPYMHNPKLKGRLHRIRIPALVLWGEADRDCEARLWPRPMPRPFRARASH